jgi:hypothetical protein
MGIAMRRRARNTRDSANCQTKGLLRAQVTLTGTVHGARRTSTGFVQRRSTVPVTVPVLSRTCEKVASWRMRIDFTYTYS